MPLVQNKPNIQIVQLLGLNELGSSIRPTNLLVRNIGHVHGVDWREVFGFEVTNGLEVLDSDALVVLGPMDIDVTVKRSDGRERSVGPFGRLGRDEFKVGVEEERRERRVGAKPCEEEDGFVIVWSEEFGLGG